MIILRRVGNSDRGLIMGITEYLEELHAALEVEVDLHGSRTKMANDLRHLIIVAEKDYLQQCKKELQQ